MNVKFNDTLYRIGWHYGEVQIKVPQGIDEEGEKVFLEKTALFTDCVISLLVPMPDGKYDINMLEVATIRKYYLDDTSKELARKYSLLKLLENQPFKADKQFRAAIWKEYFSRLKNPPSTTRKIKNPA